jgi:hypothetical protein
MFHLIENIRPKIIPKRIIYAIDNNIGSSSIRMYVRHARVDEDFGWKVPLVWDYDDVMKIKGFDKLIEIVKGKKVVEIGGGNGYLGFVLAHYAMHVDIFEGWAPYAVVYSNYIFPEVVEKRLSLNYIIRYVAKEDLKYLGKYDIGIYSGLDKYIEILDMLSEIAENVIWISFCNAINKNENKLNTDLSICVFKVSYNSMNYPEIRPISDFNT